MIYDGLMEYGYSEVDDSTKVRMLMNGINTNALSDCKAAILARPDIQGDFDISARNFLDFIAMTTSLQNNSTAKLASMARCGGGRRGGSGSDCGSRIAVNSCVQSPMTTIQNKYFCGSEQGYVPTAE